MAASKKTYGQPLPGEVVEVEEVQGAEGVELLLPGHTPKSMPTLLLKPELVSFPQVFSPYTPARSRVNGWRFPDTAHRGA